MSKKSRKALTRENLALKKREIDRLHSNHTLAQTTVPPIDLTEDEVTTIREAWVPFDGDWFGSLLGFGGRRQGHIETSGPQQRSDQEIGYETWRKNPLAATIVSYYSIYPLSDGVGYSVPGVDTLSASIPSHGWEDVSDALTDFWRQNRLNIRQYQFAEELSLNGENFFRYFPMFDHSGEFEGVRVISFDPSTVDFIATHPEDVEQVLYIHQKYWAAVRPDVMLPPDGSFPTADWVKQIEGYENVVGFQLTSDNPDEILTEEILGYPGGKKSYDPARGYYAWITRKIPASEITHPKINALSWETRGRSDLARVVNWLREYQVWLQAMVRLTKAAGFYLIDVSVKGGGPAIDAAAAANRVPPLPGSIKFHSDTEEWNVITPTLSSQSYAEVGVALIQLIAAGVKLATFMLGNSGDTSFAGGNMQFAPVVKSFENRAKIIASSYAEMFSKVIQIYQSQGRIPLELPVLDHAGNPIEGKTVNPAVADLGVRLPEVNEIDLLERATAMVQLNEAGIASKQAAQEILDLNPDEMKQELADEAMHQAETQSAVQKKYPELLPDTQNSQASTSTPASNIVKVGGGSPPQPGKPGGGRAYPNHQKSTTPKNPRRSNS